jgi:hypothetical protein
MTALVRPRIVSSYWRDKTVDEQEVFAYLKKQKKGVLLDYLREAFREMTAKQRRAVFGDALRQSPARVVKRDLLRAALPFLRRDSRQSFRVSRLPAPPCPGAAPSQSNERR